RPRLERAVPWLDGAGTPLSSLHRAGRLSQFSVIVEALLAERRLTRAWMDALAQAADGPAPAGAAAGVETRSAGPGGSTGAARSAVAGGRQAAGGRGAAGGSESPVGAASAGSGDVAAATLATGPGRAAGATPAAGDAT